MTYVATAGPPGAGNQQTAALINAAVLQQQQQLQLQQLQQQQQQQILLQQQIFQQQQQNRVAAYLQAQQQPQPPPPPPQPTQQIIYQAAPQLSNKAGATSASKPANSKLIGIYPGSYKFGNNEFNFIGSPTNSASTSQSQTQPSQQTPSQTQSPKQQPQSGLGQANQAALIAAANQIIYQQQSQSAPSGIYTQSNGGLYAASQPTPQTPSNYLIATQNGYQNISAHQGV